MILLDTDHCVFFIRGHPEVVAAFESRASDQPAISMMTVGELFFGALRSARPQKNTDCCKALIDRVNVMPLDQDVMLQYAETKADLAERGEILDDPDLLIAATALHHDVTLVTRNSAHFARVPGLRLEDWCK
jgi:tRNA(fMet)-specific endonuclease VapC